MQSVAWLSSKSPMTPRSRNRYGMLCTAYGTPGKSNVPAMLCVIDICALKMFPRCQLFGALMNPAAP